MLFTSGLPETLCGAGSTLGETEHLRAQLPIVFAELDIRSLLDAPCGDFNWMARVDLTDIEYIGADINEDNLRGARRRADRDFRLLDIVTGALPKTDAMLCRDFHQHLPNRMVFSALRNFLASGIKWLIATSHNNAANEDIAKAGMFRRVNLMAAPFGLSRWPAFTMADPPGSGHYLCVWSRRDVASAIV